MEQHERLAVVVVLVLSAAVLALRTLPGESFLERSDRIVHGLGEAWLEPPLPPPDDITVVLVDDESLTRLGERWPLSRGQWGRFFRKAARFHPAAIGVDAWFETPAPKDAVELARDIVDRLEDVGLDEEAEGEELIDHLEDLAVKQDGDRQMSEAIAVAGNVVLGVTCLDHDADTLQQGGTLGMRPVEGVPDDAGHLIPCHGLAGSLPVFTMAARRQAALTVKVDSDGIIRRYAYVFRAQGKVFPTIGLALAQVARPTEADELLEHALAHDRGAPFLLYHRSARFRHIRFSDVLEAPEDSAPLKEALADKIVLVGVSALGTQDFVTTTVEPDIPGVHVHANAVANLLADTLLDSEGPPAYLGAAGGFLLLLLLALVLWKTQRVTLVVIATAIACVLWSAAAAAAPFAGWVIPVVPVLGCIFVWANVRLLFAYLRGLEARRRAKEIREAFQHYLAPAVVQALIDNPDKLQLGGERRQITAFFSDVKGFTSISEKLDPADLVQLLNECLGSMTEIILEEGGIIDKYIGDAIVGIFGAPMEQADHAERCCCAAIRCQRALDRMRPGWEAKGWPEILVRIGVNTGIALVGNMGSEQRFDYTMLGDTVNLAARLEGANNQYGTWLMAGQQTVMGCSESILFRELDAVRVKGKKQPVRIFEIMAQSHVTTTEQWALTEAFNKTLEAYRDQRWDDARAGFAALHEQGDAPSGIFLGRVDQFEEDPPPEDWDGVYTMTSKK